MIWTTPTPPLRQQTRSWAQTLAYFAAALFAVASGATNLLYGLAKGTDVGTSLVWAAVSVATSIVFLLAWPALLLALEQRKASRIVAMLFALLLSGSYSVTAALGSASGGRTNAAIAEQTITDQRTKLQATYDTARAELALLKPTRPVAELDALVVGAKLVCRIAVEAGRRDTTCVKPPALTAELGRAHRRAELERKMEIASANLAALQPAKVANSDAAALAGYLSAVGFSVEADIVNRWLVILAVLVIECCGGLALAVGIALSPDVSSIPEACQSSSTSSEQSSSGHARTRKLGTANVASTGAAISCPAVFTLPIAARMDTNPLSLAGVQFLSYLRERGGVLVAGQRAMAEALGWSKSWTNVVLHELANAGLVKLNTGKSGTVVQLAAAA
jgi:hypothetical protein